MTRSCAAWWLAVLLCFGPLAFGADEPSAFDKEVGELYKSAKLFDKAQYKAVRGLFAADFARRHADVLKAAWGADHGELTAWLEAHADLRDDFYTALDEKYDKLDPALKLFHRLWKADAARVEAYGNLAIAVAIVWDEPSAVYDYTRHQERAKSKMPAEVVEGVENFNYIVDEEKAFEGRARHMPWEFFVFVVDHRTPLPERKWAQGYYQSSKGRVKSWHQDPPYDMDMLNGERTRDPKYTPKLTDRDYTLKNLKQYGGVCAHQADFAARIGKSLCAPAVYCSGASAFRGRHAWTLLVQIQQATKDKMTFTLVSDGRLVGFERDAFYTGEVVDPKTGEKMLDRDMERRLNAAGTDRVGKRHAELIMRAYAGLAEKVPLDRKARVAYVDHVLKVSPYNEAAWLAFAAMARDGELEAAQKSVVLNHLTSMYRTFGSYPDFIWKVFDDLLTVQPDKKERVRLYETVVALFEKQSRPDLACDARLKIADLQAEQSQWAAAARGLVQTVRKFPTEGRYVPRLVEKLVEVSKNHKAGNMELARLFVELLPAMVVHYQDDKNDYFVKMNEQAEQFLAENKLDRQAAELKAKLNQARLSVRTK